MGRRNLSVVILQHVAHGALQDTGPPAAILFKPGGVLAQFAARPAGFDANHAHRLVCQEWMKQSLLQAIRKHEKRLDGIKVDVTVKQEEVSALSMERRVKKRLDIYITGRLTATSEDITFRDSFFVSPLSYS